jgi:hypothetical protein
VTARKQARERELYLQLFAENDARDALDDRVYVFVHRAKLSHTPRARTPLSWK